MRNNLYYPQISKWGFLKILAINNFMNSSSVETLKPTVTLLILGRIQ